ncbi:unnamed protein product [Rotaria socialis]
MENDRSLLLRELFNNPRTILKELIRGARLPLNYLDTIYHSDFDEQNFDMKDGTFSSYSIKEVAGQIGLSPVFEKIYTILNRLSRGEHQHRLNPNDHVRVLYDDAQFYGVILDIFNSKTNKWRTVFDRREYAFEWVMVHRIFKR